MTQSHPKNHSDGLSHRQEGSKIEQNFFVVFGVNFFGGVLEKFNSGTKTFRTLIIGAGGGGTGPLVYAAQKGLLDGLLDSGVAVIDRQCFMGRGTIGQYVIQSDTAGGTLLECLDPAPAKRVFVNTAQSMVKQAVEQHRNVSVPLQLIGEYMTELGSDLQNYIEANPHSRFFPRTTATDVRTLPDGRLQAHVLVRAENGTVVDEGDIVAEKLVLSVGGRQNHTRTLASPIVPGLIAGQYADKVMFTDVAQQPQGVQAIEKILSESQAQRGSKKVLIIGASHSAFSTAWTLLNKVNGQNVPFGAGDITLLHRDKLKLFYMSKEAAWQDGYTDFNEDDLCPVTKRVYRLGGLRLESRQLLMRIWGMLPGEAEQRVRLMKIDAAQDAAHATEIKSLFDEADLVIPAFGYEPNVMPIYDAGGNPINLMCQREGGRMVDTECRVLDDAGQPLPNVYAIGFVTGYKLTGELGGEPSYKGQNNGLWLYQNGVGEIIVNHLMKEEPVLA